MSKEPGYKELKRRLALAEETLSAIRRGEVDVLIGEDKTYILRVEALKKALARSVRQWETVFNAVSDTIMLLDADRRVLRYNRAVLEVFGKKAGEVEGRRCWEVVHGTHCPPEGCPFELTKKSLQREQIVLSLGDRVFRVSVDPLLDDDGAFSGAVHILSDITAERRAQAEREALEVQLRQAQKMEAVGRLAGGVAHDFNNMLSIITGYGDLAMERLERDHPVRKDLGEILKAARRSAGLVRQLLAFARRQTASPRVLNLNRLVEDSLKMLGRLVGEDVEVRFIAGEDLWSVYMDPSQVDQILANLAVNARDAIEGVGTITIETGNKTLADGYEAEFARCKPGQYVMLVFSDTGCGMDPETLEKIFEPFFTTKEEGRGTGLGLSTVYGIVKQNKGGINVYSEPGRGTTFKIYLPRHEGSAREETPGKTPVPAAAGQTVLVVEDDPQILELGKIILKKLGYRVITAPRPEEAIRLSEQHDGPIHLLLTDVVMPGMNGKELKERMEAIKPGIKVLYMSGYTADVIARRGVLPEGVAFVQKPFSSDELGRKVAQVLAAR
ncbi:MAG: response regulator [Deltaproteobacteria bacterium]|nr:response regulator [Deltaproteobacteria bacterium]MBW1922946.1 response regulator [Deltaproteobacteria bacterium]MBW1950693.1 response regulator [Deltaproteobacteria bacterium]MBW2008535.1 response regulator [Deltaproteobacteria bacterium]MBW2101615.1 response regulator [Deltaproteobacteria bacterium]